MEKGSTALINRKMNESNRKITCFSWCDFLLYIKKWFIEKQWQRNAGGLLSIVREWKSCYDGVNQSEEEKQMCGGIISQKIA